MKAIGYAREYGSTGRARRFARSSGGEDTSHGCGPQRRVTRHHRGWRRVSEESPAAWHRTATGTRGREEGGQRNRGQAGPADAEREGSLHLAGAVRTAGRCADLGG